MLTLSEEKTSRILFLQRLIIATVFSDFVRPPGKMLLIRQTERKRKEKRRRKERRRQKRRKKRDNLL